MNVMPTVSCLTFSALLLGLHGAHLSAQQIPPRTTTFTLPAAPTAAALRAYDLKWITTGNDFDQSSLDSMAIDAEIGRRIRAYDRETPIVTFDVPINSKRLVKLPSQKYVAFDPRIGVLNVANNAGPLDRTAHFWRYGSFHVAVPGDTYRDQLNVYAVARALEILRNRYPEAYERLFVAPRSFPTGAPSQGRYKNRYSTVLFSFDESPDPIAGGLTALGEPVKHSGSALEEYSNVAVVSIDNTTTQGASAVGSRAVYGLSPDESYVRYLREGLVETLVHEMLHRYVDYRHSYDRLYNELYRFRGAATPSDSSLRMKVEEAVITTTSLQYFVRSGGLQSNVPFYYRGVLDDNIQAMTAAGLADRFARLVTPHLTGTFYVDRLRLPVLN